MQLYEELTNMLVEFQHNFARVAITSPGLHHVLTATGSSKDEKTAVPWWVSKKCLTPGIIKFALATLCRFLPTLTSSSARIPCAHLEAQYVPWFVQASLRQLQIFFKSFSDLLWKMVTWLCSLDLVCLYLVNCLTWTESYAPSVRVVCCIFM